MTRTRTRLRLGQPRLRGNLKGPPWTPAVLTEVVNFDSCFANVPLEAYPSYPTLPSISEPSWFGGPALTAVNEWGFGFDTESCNLVVSTLSDEPDSGAQSEEGFVGIPSGLPGHALAEVEVGDQVRVQGNAYARGAASDGVASLQFRIQSLDSGGAVDNQDTVMVGPFTTGGATFDFTHTITAAGNLRVAWVLYLPSSQSDAISIALSAFSPFVISVG